MDYIKIRFDNDFNQMASRIEESIDDIFRSMNPMFNLSERKWKPQMDIYETPDEIIILAEIAGVKKENLEIEINSKAVKIFGVRAEPPRMKNTTYRLAEIQYGRFERVLFLPSPIDTDKVSAAHLNGFLQLRLTKLPVNVTHKIPIHEG
ncbi:MAG: Hsp20/alpha crystallin family protein [Desulfobacterales bacterium]|nr:Hsp20/alpha crystallin family protein [Desulfobacterales bacterium]MDD4071713.1 Hsp20/alpha crystallin family protein [Desulfobacterales bacterium]MDD4391383.1 Hsp20/alpha crystallin family protein [Desulfobacterales bacterium]